tara:strand:+ start:123 stop:1157 length:1035 start_codon:yes stop_codon:yes gene_type:complete
MIGLMIPSAFAENTIGFDFIHYPTGLDFPIIQDTVIINGHVKFENDKAVGLGIGPGYQITAQVFSSDDKLVYTQSKKSNPLENVSSLGTISKFAIWIPSEEFTKPDRYSVYIFYGPPESSFKNTQYSGLQYVFVGTDPTSFQEKLNREQQSQIGTTFATTPQDAESYIWILVIIFIIAITGFIARTIYQNRRSRTKRFGLSEEDLRNNFRRFNEDDAEDLVKLLFEKKGYDTKVGVESKSGEIKRSGDFGIDVRATISTKRIGFITKKEKLGIQVKHWENNVGFDDAAKTMGVSEEYDKVIIVSTKADFTHQVYENKKERKNWKKLELWNSEKFKDELRKYVLR